MCFGTQTPKKLPSASLLATFLDLFCLINPIYLSERLVFSTKKYISISTIQINHIRINQNIIYLQKVAKTQFLSCRGPKLEGSDVSKTVKIDHNV